MIFVFNIRQSAAAKVSLTPQARAAVEAAAHLHIVGSSLISPAMTDTILWAAEHLKAKGGTVSFDPNIRREIAGSPGLKQALSRVLALTDLYLPSGDELFLFTRTTDPDMAIRALLAGGIAAVVHKQGALGARYVDTNIDVFEPARTAEEVDPTGAGDIFGATFVTGWLSGHPPQENLRRANIAGMLAVSREGPMEGVSSQADIAGVLSRP